MAASEEELQNFPHTQILRQVISNFPLNKLQTVGELCGMLRLLERLSPPMELDLDALEKSLERERGGK